MALTAVLSTRRLPPRMPTSSSGSAMDRYLAKAARVPPTPMQRMTSKAPSDPYIGKIANANLSSAKAANDANTLARRQFNTLNQRDDVARIATNQYNRKVLELLDKIRDGVLASDKGNGIGLLDAIGGASVLKSLLGGKSAARMAAAGKMFRNSKGQFIKRPATWAGRVANRLGATKLGRFAGSVAKRTGLARVVTGARAGRGLIGGAGRVLGGVGRVAGKFAAPVAAVLAIADAIQGVKDADKILGRKANNADKIGIAISSAIDGALLGIPSFITKKIFGKDTNFAKGMNNLGTTIAKSWPRVFAGAVATVLGVTNKITAGVDGYFKELNSNIDGLVAAIRARDWKTAGGYLAKIVKSTTPMGAIVGAAATAAPTVARTIAAAPAAISNAATVTGAAVTKAATVVGDTAVKAGSTVAGWLGLGSTSKKYESGKGGAGTVSSGKGDPGGASYGTYQLASKTGTLNRFLQSSGYGKHFAGMTPGSKEFNTKWKEIAKTDPKFGEAQHDFIKRTHYDPAAKYAASLGFDINDKGIADAIWSASVQHGGVKKILKQASQSPGWAQLDNKGKIKRLYEVRSNYAIGAMQRNGASAQQVASVSRRYTSEVNDALALSGQEVTLTKATPSAAPMAVSPTMATAKSGAAPQLASTKAAKPTAASMQAFAQAPANPVAKPTAASMKAFAKAPTASATTQTAAAQPTMQTTAKVVSPSVAVAVRPAATTAPRATAVANSDTLNKPMPPPPKPQPQPIIVQQAAASTDGNAPSKLPAKNVTPPEASYSSGAQLPPIDTIPTYPSLELLAVAGLSFR